MYLMKSNAKQNNNQFVQIDDKFGLETDLVWQWLVKSIIVSV